MRILLVEDDVPLAAAIAEALADEGHAVDHAATGAEAAGLARRERYELVVLDWSIPPPTGLELLQGWRAAGFAAPVLMLTARGQVADRVRGLDAGADDYLPKPFAIAELLARVRMLLRRGEREPSPHATADLVLDRAAHTAIVDGERIRLTPKELGVLEYLLSRLDHPVSREELAEHVWDQDFEAASNTLGVIVYRLRKKIDGERSDRLLHTVPGAGYMLAARRRAQREPTPAV